MGGKSSKSFQGEQYILVMGSSGAGKTTFINNVSGSRLAVSDDILNCTLEDQMSQSFQYQGRMIRMIDTVGFDDPDASDAELLMNMQMRLGKIAEVKQQLVGVIYLHDITLLRTGNSAIRMINQFEKVIGKTAAQNVVIVTTKWDIVDRKVGEARQKRLSEHPKVFGPLTRRGVPMMRYSHNDNPYLIMEKLFRSSGRP